MTSKIELAWAAGFFEGEGSFIPAKNRPRRDGSNTFRTHASLSQKDRGLLVRFQSIVGFGGITKHGGLLGVYQWKTSRVGEAAKLLKLLRFQLSQRRISRAERLLHDENKQVFRWGGKGPQWTKEYRQ